MNQIGMFNETDVELTEEEKMIQKLVKEVLKEEKVRNAECNIIFVDNEKIHEINREYRHIDRVTDVISFALEDEMENEPSAQYEMRVLGDIYISVDRAKEQALEYGHSPGRLKYKYQSTGRKNKLWNMGIRFYARFVF